MTEGVHTSVVGDAHGYTRSRVPWRIDIYRDRLTHYLSGGGMRTFGRTIRQEEVRLRQNRFLAGAGVVGVCWLLLWLF